MSKLTLKDVKIIGEGPQIRRVIEQSFGSLEEFYKVHSDITNKFATLLNYLSRDVIISDSFKCKITLIFDADYPTLYVTKQNQIKKHVQKIYDEIEKYDQYSDKETLDYLLELCKEEKMEEELARMYRAKAKNYHYTSKITRSREYYEYAIEAVPRGNANMLVYFNCELADSMLRENSIDKAEKKYKHIAQLVRIHRKKLNKDTLFFYYYWRGILYLFKGEYDFAKDLFGKAEENSTFNRAKASAIANIALACKYMNKYDEALEHYQEALKYPDPSRLLTTTSIYNNMAVVYKCEGDYDSALTYVEKALEIFEKEDNIGKHLICIATKDEILMELGEIKTYKNFFNELLSIKGKHNYYKPDVLIEIKNCIMKTNDISCLDELGDIIIELEDASTNEDYNRGLNECGGLIYSKTKKLTKGVYHEKAK